MIFMAHQLGHKVNVLATAAPTGGAHGVVGYRRHYGFGYRYIRREAWKPLQLLPRFWPSFS